MKTYTYQEQYPDCYSLHRPYGTDFCFLQGDDARYFEKELEGIDSQEFTLEAYNKVLSVIIDQYDC